MAHINDLQTARAAAESVANDYDRAELFAKIAYASALTDIAAAVEDISREFKSRRRNSR
ncbi:hypothetical protein Cali_186 [Mycobacterium phage Cali]|uniref:Uncharacterized protein n=45 Tax=Bixzunavirus TaxID=680114 RepID=Q853C0_BPMBZ|nr:gp183 [Mycobacterium phage Bxz1]YP_002224185.1 hypothetical protein SCOTTMCG_186 [Mycobacterium phage ScottMcG]YP_002224409.1 gp188 [Mycobacterium phage Spud]YP_002224630.1 gp186 [Mycobacterium phage Cali]YP_002224851.1 gp186 [Mycobacterium phage Rizal]YP_003347830.1 hypothetical protein ET08_180 [Mycobacterium phage ET08]YP_008060963.1 hypothetical protein M181_gp164 [Mycobacterium phage Gizmo]YP_008061420.1 hypothetical protein M180_gp160 [Mycobacterium phage ArcherS7]YP_008061652.1 hy